MTRSNCRRMLFVLLLATVAGAGEPAPNVAAFPAQPADLNSDSWLNARDFGASGSKFETTAATTDGSKQITVANVGDFLVGQGVMVSRCNIRYTHTQLWGTGEPYRNSKPLENSVEVRGYDGSAGSWVIYLLDIEPSASPAFRWSDDLAGPGSRRSPSHTIGSRSTAVSRCGSTSATGNPAMSLPSGRDQLVSRIEKIEGTVLTLKDAANRTVQDAVVRHNDTFALQAAIDRALTEKRNVYVPAGHYRLARGMRVTNAAAITIEGASSVDTLLDLSDGEGACFTLSSGTEVTIRNFRMIGFMGFDERDKAGYVNTRVRPTSGASP